MIRDKHELDDEILKVCHEMKRPKFIKHYIEISNWFEKFLTYPVKRKDISDFFFAGTK
jgi:hypothetical protein